MRPWLVVAVCTLCVGRPALRAQQSVDAPARFDVASIKPASSRTSQVAVSQVTFRNGQFVASNHTARRLILHAYRLPTSRVVGGPGWMDTDAFDVEARTSAATSDDEARVMLRSLLHERFQLQTHSEMREGTAYTLIRVRPDRLGPQLVSSKIDCATADLASRPQQKGESVAARPRRCAIETFSDRRSTTFRAAVPIAELARALAKRLGTSVIDDTGLSGRYDIDLRFAPDTLSTREPSEWPTLMPAIQAQLGLRLQPSKTSIEFIVIDRIARPTEN